MNFFINFFDNINDDSARKLMELCSQVRDTHNPESITILFSSGGGFVNSGVCLYNFLKAFPCEIIMHNIGNIDSSAVIVFLAGSKRFSSPVSSFLLHGITWNFLSDAQFKKEQLSEILSGMEENEKRIAKILSSNTSLTTEEVENIFKQGETKTPDFAKEKGIVHEIKEPKIEKDDLLFNV